MLASSYNEPKALVITVKVAMRVLSESSCIFCKFCYNCEIIATISPYQECNKDKTYIAVASYIMTASYKSHHSSLVGRFKYALGQCNFTLTAV